MTIYIGFKKNYSKKGFNEIMKMEPTVEMWNITIFRPTWDQGMLQYIQVLLQITMGLLQIIGMKEILNNLLIAALVIYPFNLCRDRF